MLIILHVSIKPCLMRWTLLDFRKYLNLKKYEHGLKMSKKTMNLEKKTVQNRESVI